MVFWINLPHDIYRDKEKLQAGHNGLVEAVRGSSRTICYRPSREPLCFEFVIGRDGSLVAAFAYDSDKGPIMLNYAIHLRTKRPAVLFYYVNPNQGERIREFWKGEGNVSYIVIDDGSEETAVKKSFDMSKKAKGSKK